MLVRLRRHCSNVSDKLQIVGDFLQIRFSVRIKSPIESLSTQVIGVHGSHYFFCLLSRSEHQTRPKLFLELAQVPKSDRTWTARSKGASQALHYFESSWIYGNTDHQAGRFRIKVMVICLSTFWKSDGSAYLNNVTGGHRAKITWRYFIILHSTWHTQSGRRTGTAINIIS